MPRPAALQAHTISSTHLHIAIISAENQNVKAMLPRPENQEPRTKEQRNKKAESPCHLVTLPHQPYSRRQARPARARNSSAAAGPQLPAS